MPNWSTRKLPSKIVDIQPLHILDLVPLPKNPRMKIIVGYMINQITTLHDKVKKKLEEIAAKYKETIDKDK